MASFTCPECQKVVKDLPAHMARMHPGKAPKGGETPAGDEGEFNLQAPAGDEGDDQEYICQNCGAKVEKLQEACTGCGQSLEWGGLA